MKPAFIRLDALCRLSKAKSGFGVIELLVVILIASIVLGNVTAALIESTNQLHDRKIVAKTEERARMLLDVIAFDLRLMGSGMPLGQEDFEIGDAALSTAPLPILLTSSASLIEFRINETGTSSILTADYTPGILALTFSVSSASEFSVGDIVYLSNAVLGEQAGLQGEITSVSGNSITIDSGYLATPSTTFAVGSRVHKVSTVQFISSAGNVSRTIGGAPTTIMPSASFTLTYLDQAGGTLAPPLSEAQVRDDLAALNLSVTVNSEQQLKNGTSYSAVASQEINLRNLKLSRP